MTIEITEFRCPVDGHIIEEEEYIHPYSEVEKIIQDKVEEKLDEMRETSLSIKVILLHHLMLINSIYFEKTKINFYFLYSGLEKTTGPSRVE